jgi:hypothetical protein
MRKDKKFEKWWEIEPDNDAPYDDEPTAIKYWAEQAWQAAQQHFASEIEELKADNERLRDAIKETIADLEKKDAIRKALSATTSKSLQEHDEVKAST